MSFAKELLRVRAEKANANKRLTQLKHEEAKLMTAAVPCKGCGAKVGQRCGKPSGVRTFPHAERVRAATALVVKLTRQPSLFEEE
jgi:hypothetical protein